MIPDLAINAVFAGPLAVPAEVRPVIGDAYAVKVVFFGAPQLTGGIERGVRRPSVALRVRVADWPAPEKGDAIFVQGALRRVADFGHADPMRLTWRMETEEHPDAL